MGGSAAAAPAPRAGRLPTFFVIGAMKCATSSLHRWLDLHPEIEMSEPKETDYFIAGRGLERGLDWYRSCWRGRATALAAGETSPNYTKRQLFAGVAERMHALLPSARLVYVVRDPLERLVSHHAHLVAAGRVRVDLNAYFAEPRGHPAVETSRYAWQLEPFLARFGPDALRVVAFERLAAEPAAVLRELATFLGARGDSAPAALPRLHATSAKRAPNALGRLLWGRRALRGAGLRLAPGLVSRPLAPERWRPDVRARVEEVLRPEAEALRRLTGLALSDWSV